MIIKDITTFRENLSWLYEPRSHTDIGIGVGIIEEIN